MKKINAEANVNWLVSRNEQKFIDLAVDIYSRMSLWETTSQLTWMIFKPHPL